MRVSSNGRTFAFQAKNTSSSLVTRFLNNRIILRWNNMQIVTGNIFDSICQTLTIPVNTVGVAGAGLAKQWKDRFPDQFEGYKEWSDILPRLKAVGFLML